MNKDEIEAVKEDINIYGALAGVVNTDGGKQLLRTLTSTISQDIDKLITAYATLTDTELRAIGARLSVTINMARALNRSQEQYELAQEYIKTLTA